MSCQVAIALKMNAVRVDAAFFGHRQQEQIEFFGRFGQPWEETARFPAQCGSNASLAMHPLLIGFHQERPQTNIKFGQAEHGSGWRRASRRVPRLMAEEGWFVVSKMRSTLPHPRGYLANRRLVRPSGPRRTMMKTPCRLSTGSAASRNRSSTGGA